jgi:hypothetical protein
MIKSLLHFLKLKTCEPNKGLANLFCVMLMKEQTCLVLIINTEMIAVQNPTNAYGGGIATKSMDVSVIVVICREKKKVHQFAKMVG